MDMNDYQVAAMRTAMYPGRGEGYVSTYPMAKLSGEVGEFCEKVGKKSRKDQTLTVSVHQFTEDERKDFLKELGDVLWYVTALVDELGSTLGEVAEMNIAKLSDRQTRGVIDGAGDNR